MQLLLPVRHNKSPAPTDAAPKLKLAQKQGELNNKINVKNKPQEGY